jgi:putative sigma-54 modulation protein
VQVSVAVRHGSLSEGTREKITAKAEKLARLFERLLAVEVTVDLEREPSVSVDIRVSAEHKHDFVATDAADSVLAATDGAIHKLEQQLRKYKEKVQDHHRG